MKCKLAQLHHLITTHNPVIIVGIATCLTPNINDSELFPPPFISMAIFRKDRLTNIGKGGVVIIATKPGLCVKYNHLNVFLFTYSTTPHHTSLHLH